MKSCGAVRKIDTVGRIVFPMELRRKLEIEVGTPMEILIDGEYLVLKKYNPLCIFCHEAKGTINYKGRLICRECLKDLRSK